MQIYYEGIVIAIATFVIIGIFHPIVIKTHYYSGTRLWWLFALLGVSTVIAALFVANTLLSAIIGVVGASLLWTVGELFQQEKRVQKGWFPKNPKRKQ